MNISEIENLMNTYFKDYKDVLKIRVISFQKPVGNAGFYGTVIYHEILTSKGRYEYADIVDDDRTDEELAKEALEKFKEAFSRNDIG